MSRACFHLLITALLSGAAPAAPVAEVSLPVWHADTFNAVHGSWSAWCGSHEVTSCGAGDPGGGYGRHYDEILEWRGVVANPAQPCTVSVSARVNIDTMDGYDYFFVSCVTAADPQVDLLFRDGHHDDLAVAARFVYLPGEFTGDGGDEVVVRFRVTSDGGWDGDDCLWPNDGAVQLDDVVISLSNGAGYSHDFEDGTLGAFRVAFPTGGSASQWPGSPRFAVQAHPNPFNPQATIRFELPASGPFALAVYDVAGRLVRVLAATDLPAGSHAVPWDGRDAAGRAVGSGSYLARLEQGGHVTSVRMALVR